MDFNIVLSIVFNISLLAGNKKGRVEEHKERGQSTIQEQANLIELQTNLVEVEDNIGEYSSPPSAYTEQCDLINHISLVSKYEHAFFMHG